MEKLRRDECKLVRAERGPIGPERRRLPTPLVNRLTGKEYRTELNCAPQVVHSSWK